MTIAQVVADATEVELRCPTGAERNGHCHPGRLLAKLRLSGEAPSYVQPDNVIEMPCRECRERYWSRHGRRVRNVLHRYDLSGAWVSTLVEDEG